MRRISIPRLVDTRTWESPMAMPGSDGSRHGRVGRSSTESLGPATPLTTDSPGAPPVTTESKAKSTVASALTVIAHSRKLIAGQFPDGPVHAEPPSGSALSVTVVPDGTDMLHVAPQSIPAGL